MISEVAGDAIKIDRIGLHRVGSEWIDEHHERREAVIIWGQRSVLPTRLAPTSRAGVVDDRPMSLFLSTKKMLDGTLQGDSGCSLGMPQSDDL